MTEIRNREVSMIDSSKIKEEVWTLFKDLIKNNVTSVTIQGSGGANTKIVTIQNVSSSFPDELFDSKTNYPMIVVNSPDFNSSPVTYRDRELSGTIEFEVFSNQSESADKILDKINDTIITNESTLRTSGIEELEIDSNDSNHYDRNKISVHSRMVVWRYKVLI